MRTLREVAEKLLEPPKKAGKQNIQLIYAFNGTGKTRLSREVSKVIAERSASPETENDEVGASHAREILYYNSFTEDLFHWDNSFDDPLEHSLLIDQNEFSDWVLRDQGQDQNLIDTFRRYTGSRATVRFATDFRQASFSVETGDDSPSRSIKISKGEESVFKWSLFYIILQQVVDVLAVAEPEERETREFDQLRYVFIDDPVSSLDDNHLIRTAVDLAELIRDCASEVQFIITTHNPLFYNVLSNELNHAKKSLLRQEEDGSYQLPEQRNDSPFAYHLHLRDEMLKAIARKDIRKYHYAYLRNLLEKLSTFLGYGKWGELLAFLENPGERLYQQRMMNISSHSKHAGDEISELSEDDKRVFTYILNEIDKTYHFHPNHADPKNLKTST